MKKNKVDAKDVITIVFSILFIGLGIAIAIIGSYSSPFFYFYYTDLSQTTDKILYKIGSNIYYSSYYYSVLIILSGIGIILLSVMKLSIASASIDKQKKLSSQKVEIVEEFGDEDNIIQKVEKMHGLYEKGVLNEDEYSKIKSNLLNRM
ncbi:MAG: hypothetical protein PHG90_03740 [Clostridia bacterium]|nr:hypothetical protein [Clostridia bacterium]